MSSSMAFDPRRPRVQTTRSFSRHEPPTPSPVSPARARANTVQTPLVSVPEAKYGTSPEEHGKSKSGDIFDTTEEHDDPLAADPASAASEVHQPETLDQLPIEIQSLTQRFLKSLSVKSHATPLNIDTISSLFQDFYVQADSQVYTHIAALTARLSREASPAPSTSSKTAIKGLGSRSSPKPDSGEFGGEQQMLTASEITDKRKARRMLEVQRVAMEEAVERGICEKVYDRIYRHRSTDDEERDAKLRSKTAALALVGIGLQELHVDVPAAKDSDEDQKQRIDKLLAPAHESIARMDSEHFPLGKLQHLKDAHKGIVEMLSQLFPSSSSADEVLPTLIYTLITYPPERLNVFSNLHFIQLFRSANKVDGEAAYCLVNLEAAISFLETVDLSSLRAEEAPEGPAKSANALGISTEGTTGLQLPEQQPLNLASPLGDVSSDSPLDSPGVDKAVSSRSATPTTPNRPQHTRRLSTLLQTQAGRIEAGRDNLLNSADQAFDSINATLENSMKFLFGRLRQQESEGHGSPVMIPKTLDDARKLVSSPPAEEEDGTTMSGASSIAGDAPSDPLSKAEGKLLEIVGGRRSLREHSADSARSGGSGKRVGFAANEDKAGAGPADAVGSFVTSLNPLSRFGVPSFPKFGRVTSGQQQALLATAEKPKQLADIPERSSPQAKRVQSEPDLNATEALARLRRAKPPARRFLEARDSKELKIGEVEDLLQDYKRLAELLKEAATS